MGKIIHDIQLVDSTDSVQGATELLQASGGMFVVTVAGDPALATLYDPDDDFSSLTQPVSLDQGKVRFAVADTVNSVDIFGITADGRPFTIQGRSLTSMRGFHVLPTKGTIATLVVPFSMDDATANTERDTGIEVPEGTLILPYPGLKVATIDATETIDVGFLSTESSGDPDGLLDGASVATAGYVQGTNVNSGATIGALLVVQDSANAGDKAPQPHLANGTNKTLSYTLSAGSDTAEGYILLRLQSPNAP